MRMLEQPDTWKPMFTEVDLDGIKSAAGLDEDARAWISVLCDEYDSHANHNHMLREYYDGNVTVSDYGVGADIPNDQTCHWPAKAVDALADRIRLESLITENGDQKLLDSVVDGNNLISNYNRHVPVKLLYGCMAATVNKQSNGRSLIRFHSAETFTALPSPDYTDGVVAGGFAIARREVTPWSLGKMVPTMVNLHVPGNIGVFRQTAMGAWEYEAGPTQEEIPTIYVFSHNGTGTLSPFGRTRITQFVRTLTDDAIRCMWHMQVSGTFYSMAKLYLTGLSDDQFNAIMASKEDYKLSRLLALTMGGEGDTVPNVGQLSGNSPQPFIDELRALACQFSGATGVPINSLGIVQDNPSSADAISAAREDICLIAERDAEADKRTLERVARAAMAVESNTTTAKLEDVDIIAKFGNPMLASLPAKADWAVKVASMRDGFGGTDVAARMVGLDEADLAKVRLEERQKRAAKSLFDEIQAEVNANGQGEDGSDDKQGAA